MERIARGVAVLAALGSLGTTIVRPAVAQESDSTGVLVGYVADQFGQPVVGAELLVVDASGERRARTADAGVYRLERIPPGEHQVRVRRAGYTPATRSVLVQAGTTRVQDWELRRLPANVDPATVQDGDGEMRLGLQAFQHRRQTAIGTFIDRAAIEQRKPRYTRDLLRGITGFRLASSGGDAVVWSTGGAGAAPCPTRMYVEGAPYTPVAGIDDFSPEDIQALEAYTAGSAVAAQLGAGDAACGALVIWLRR